MRSKAQFTEAMNFRIAQMVEINKTLQEIRQDLIDNFDFKVSTQTLSNQIKSIGYTDYDCRKTSDRGTYQFTDIEKNFIKLHYENGSSLKEIKNELKKVYNTEVTEPTINKFIKQEGFIKGEMKELNWYDDEEDWEDIENSYYVPVEKDIDTIDNKIEASEYYKMVLNQLKQDPKIERYNSYMSGNPYNYNGNGEREGMKDTWYTRDGFLKIFVGTNIYPDGKNKVDYTAGEYAFGLDRELDFYTFANEKSFYQYALFKSDKLYDKRIEIRDWYKEHRPRINELYDIIIENNYASTIPEITEFNKLCKEMYNLKMEYKVLYYSINEQSRKLLQPKNELNVNDFAKFDKYMTDKFGKEWGKFEPSTERFS